MTGVLICVSGCDADKSQSDHSAPSERPSSARSQGDGTAETRGAPSRVGGPKAGTFDFSELDQFIAHHRNLYRRTAVIIRKDGEIIYSFGDTLSPVNAASCSKWLGAAAILRLVERNTLSLDAPAGNYLPSGLKNGKKRLHSPPRLPPRLRLRAKQMTLRQLLSHTAGLRAFDPFNERTFANGNTASGNGNGGNGNEMLPYRSAMDNLRFRGSPDPAFCYENAGFNFAGMIATWVAHKPWPILFQEEIATPMGLYSTYFSKQKPSLAGGAMVSASDYSRFLEMFRNGGVSMEGDRILAKKTVDEMLKNQTAGLPMACVPRPSPRKESYGLGLWRQGPDARPWLASHFGTSGYKVFLDFCRNLSAVFVMEYKPSRKKRGRDESRDIYEIIQRAIPVDASCAKEMEQDRHQWTPPLRPPADGSIDISSTGLNP
ncbi:MAG: beta-lactamase family protein [Deltaproteobacteria bacterium]|nr:beta-lactamase family protein [Deltaproteobacteria bacterium]